MYECRVCGKEFPLTKYYFKDGEQIKFTCSRECAVKDKWSDSDSVHGKGYPWYNEDGTPVMYACKICGTEFPLTRHNFKEGKQTKFTCSRKCALQYNKTPSYQSLRKYPWKNDDGTQAKYHCKVCGKEFPLTYRHFKDGKQIRFTCSKKCTLCYNYGGPSYDYELAKKEVSRIQREKYKETTGFDNPSQNPEVKEKKRQSIIEHYGNGTDDADTAYKNVYKIQQKAYKEKTGYDNPSQNPEVRAKVEKTVQDKYGVDNVFQSHEIMDGARSKTNTISKINRAWHDEILNTTGIDMEYEVPFTNSNGESCRADLGYGNILIDFNPTISHNSDVGYLCAIGKCGDSTGSHKQCASPLPRDYHQSRTLGALSGGKKLINVYDWSNKQVVMNIIRKACGVSESVAVNDCTLSVISFTEAYDFITVQHTMPLIYMKGSVQSNDTYCLGVYHGDILVQAYIFGHSENGGDSWELLAASESNTVMVTDGMKSAVAKFIQDNHPDSILVTVDLDTNYGITDELTDFKEDHIQPFCALSPLHTTKSSKGNYVPVFTSGSMVYRWDAEANA